MRLKKEFFLESATTLAPKLLGKYICTEKGRFRIVETECYYGEDDTACHASKGKTPRTQTMYCEGGVLYVYLCYGIHYLLNIVTGCENSYKASKRVGVDYALSKDRDKLWRYVATLDI